MLGLDLLRLLVQNRIAEFHTELELLTPEVGGWEAPEACWDICWPESPSALPSSDPM